MPTNSRMREIVGTGLTAIVPNIQSPTSWERDRWGAAANIPFAVT